MMISMKNEDTNTGGVDMDELSRQTDAVIEKMNEVHKAFEADSQKAVVPQAEEIDHRRVMIKDLGVRLEAALNFVPVHNEDITLYDHAHALDLMFKRLLHSAEERLDKGHFYLDPSLYALALKAQDQFRRTLVAAKAMRDGMENASTT